MDIRASHEGDNDNAGFDVNDGDLQFVTLIWGCLLKLLKGLDAS